jgi:hypothetical protein
MGFRIKGFTKKLGIILLLKNNMKQSLRHATWGEERKEGK